MSNILNRLNNSFINSISAKDKRHIWFILSIIAVLIVINAIVGHINPPVADINGMASADSSVRTRLAALDSLYQSTLQSDTLSRLDAYILKRYDTIALFQFDPNTAGKEQLLKLGLTGKQADNILNYRNKGGQFADAEDFRKMYGMRTMQFRILKPYININQQNLASNTSGKRNQESGSKNDSGQKYGEDGSNSQKAESKEIAYFDFDPNSISAEDFARLGFSPKQAESFVKYRDKGKKFYVPQDITDAYCVDDKAFARIRNYIKINIDSLTENGKIRDLNTIDKEGLKACGISDDEAQQILDFRAKAGFYYAPWQISDVIGNKKGNKLKSAFYVCRSVERKLLNINTASVEDMVRNPYFSQDKAARIEQARHEIGKLEARHLVELQIFSESDMKRVANYISY